MRLDDFIRLAGEYQRLGWAVQGQFQAVLEGEDAADQNPNALDLAAKFLVTAGRFDIDSDDIEDALDLLREPAAAIPENERSV